MNYIGLKKNSFNFICRSGWINGFKAVFLFVCCFCFLSSQAWAQKIGGTYTGPILDKKLDSEEIVIPRVFSSEINSKYAEKAEDLDKIYHNLNIDLREYARVNFTHQTNLLELMQPHRFELTRYGKEFRKELLMAMQELNENYKEMEKSIEQAHDQYKLIKENFPEHEQSRVEILWNNKIKAFMKQSEEYFILQNTFLNIYKNLVQFVLNQSGGYYYDPSTKQLTFYKVGAYTYYGKAIEKLIEIGRKQKVLLEEMTSGYYEDPYVLPDE